MSKYIDIGAIPTVSRGGTKYPYEEWVAIPEGQALEITPLLDGVKVDAAQSCLTPQLKRRNLGLVAMRRQDRLWIARPKRAAS